MEREPRTESPLPRVVPREEYPFASHFLEVDDGVRLHYVDEGAGPPVLMLHGNPTWSFYYRRLALALRGTHRVVAPDHVGCGLSDKPDDAHYRYTLATRIRDVGRLIDHLGLGADLTLVVHDWGGAIGCGWAVEHPDRLARLVVFNSAAFQFQSVRPLPSALKLVRDSRLGALLVERFNAFARGAAWIGCQRQRMPAPLRDAYCAPYATPAERRATLRFVQDIPLGPGDPAWETGQQIEAGLPRLQHLPLLLCWGMRDFVFDPAFLARWLAHFPHAEVLRLPDAGHYVLEDAFEEILPRVRAFLGA